MLKITLAPLTALLIAVPAYGKSKTHCHSRSCEERVARKHCNQNHPRWCVERAIITYRLRGWSSAWMRRIPGCESGWNPYAYFGNPTNHSPRTGYVNYNDISAGLYEFKPSTWKGLGFPIGLIWSAKWQAIAAARMVRAGRTGEWVCQ